MADPSLKLVPQTQVGDTPGPARPEGERRDSRRVLFLALLLIAAALGLGIQTSRVDNLEARVDQLGAELSASRAELATARAQTQAYHRQLDQIRSSVSELSARVLSLDALVQRDPLAADAR